MTNNNQLSSNPLQLKMPVVGKRYICKIGDYGIYKFSRRAFWSNGEPSCWMDVSEKKNPKAPDGITPSLKSFWDYFEELPEQEESTIKREWFNTFDPARVEKAKEELRNHINLNSDTKFGIETITLIQNLLNAMDETQINQETAETLKNSREGKGLIKCNSIAEALESWDENDDCSIGEDAVIKEPVFDDKKADISSAGNAPNGLIKDKPKSIWKPVSELPTNNSSVILKAMHDGNKFFGFYTIKDGFTTLAFPGCGANWAIEYCTLTDYFTHQAELEKRIERLEQKEK